MSVSKGGDGRGRVARQLQVDVCHKWWTGFSAMCVFAWQTRWFTGGDFQRSREYGVAMGAAPSTVAVGDTFAIPLVDRPHVFFCSPMVNPLQICMFCNGGEPPATEAHVAQ